ncbi:GNAT family N-acetyltransferase [Polaribacter porphyrae]|uniref:Ribosomal-protein-serine acetyltransferase n=1 Tax=Polaribacter porphyrae TaxID=1137780 RepID=A0A2S7WJH5_9FLAO|nr:GNAT family N-acetyltransferase [Polaribacter porphyrae]PQJ77758.1 ribosomal-protein-serine acetyltransferase [Polaribacter porphyrae]
MIFPLKYVCLKTNVFKNQEFKIVPIRFEDRQDIMEWRNEQMYHLRQVEPLSKESQDNYYRTTIYSLFPQEKPNQILFSFLKNDELIGYGGLVHVNWVDRNAEISFIMKTELEENYFSLYWSSFLNLIEIVAFNELNMHKIYVYAFDLRPHLYKVLKANRYFKDAILKDHCYFNNLFLDVVIHSKINNK